MGVGIVVTSGSICCAMVAHWPRDVGSILTLGTVIPTFITPTILQFNRNLRYANSGMVYKRYDRLFEVPAINSKASHSTQTLQEGSL